MVVVVTSSENLLRMSSKLFNIGPSEDIVKKVNLASILSSVRTVYMKAQLNRELTRAQDSAGGACGFDILFVDL